MPGAKNAANSTRKGNCCGVYQKRGLQVRLKLKMSDVLMLLTSLSR